MGISNKVRNFDPKTNGFHFNDNDFKAGSTFAAVTLPLLGTVYSGDAHDGICDGLAFSALDLFLHNPPLVPPVDSAGPASITDLFKYLTQRENDAFLAGGFSNIWKALQWIHTPSHDTGFDIWPFGHVVTQRGLSWLTVTEEWPKIKADVDAGRPSPVWLVTPPECPVTNLPQTANALKNHHQVLVYGYALDDANNLTLTTYEPQDHDTAHTITFNVSNPEHTISFPPTVYGAPVRGLFRSYYEYRDASAIALPVPQPAKTKVALQTQNGHTLTFVNGGGLGGPNSGAGAVALHTDATVAGPWEKFTVEWIDTAQTQLALKTVNGRYVTAVNGGGMGGPNDATSPVHTDATWVGPWEVLSWNYDAATKTVTLQTPNGRYLTAVNGGGFGGPNNTPIHTDATARGPWETFKLVHVP